MLDELAMDIIEVVMERNGRDLRRHFPTKLIDSNPLESILGAVLELQSKWENPTL